MVEYIWCIIHTLTPIKIPLLLLKESAFYPLNPSSRYQGNISCKDGLDKGQKGMDLTEAENIKKRWQE